MKQADHEKVNIKKQEEDIVMMKKQGMSKWKKLKRKNMKYWKNKIK